MANDINGINSNVRIKPADSEALKTASRSAAVKKDETKEIQKDDRIQKEVYGSVIASSGDGDTVSAKKQALEALETGMVFKKDDETQRAVNSQESLSGYSEDQLESMYLRGDINKVKYDREIQRREELKGEEPSKTELSKEAVAKEAEEEEKEAEALKTEEEKREERAEDAAKGDASERIKEAQKENEAFSKEMGVLNARKEDTELKSEALKEGIANDRAALVEDIFTGGGNH